MAWLWTVAKDRTAPRCEPGKEQEHLPDIQGFEYLAEAFFECGPDDITWQSLASYSDTMGVQFTPWESSVIRKMSRAYVQGVKEYSGTEAARPFTTEAHKGAVMTRMQEAIRGRRLANGGHSKGTDTGRQSQRQDRFKRS